MTRSDVVVIGAGLAGLGAARRLREAGHEVRVLEARDRVGGRTWSQARGGAVLDLGAQWVGPAQHRVLELARELGLETYPQHHHGEKVIDVDGELRRYRGSIPRLGVLDLLQTEWFLRRFDRMARAVPLESPGRAARAATWDAMSVESFKQRMPVTRHAKALLDVGVRTIFGAEPAELSLLYFLYYLNSAGGLRTLVEIEGGAQEARFVEGAQTLSERLAARLDGAVVLSAPVHEIEGRPDGVLVRGAAGEHAGRFALVAVPPPLLARIRISPPLPPWRAQLAQRWAMGATVKVFCVYERASWRARGLSGEAICPGGPFSVVFDASSRDGALAALLGFAVGNHARAWSRMTREARRETAAREMERLFGAPARALVDCIELDWAAEPWTGGCPVAGLAPGALVSLGEGWRDPVGRVHFAGTETARYWNGYMEGALESAERAAGEILARLASRADEAPAAVAHGTAS